MTAPPPYQHSVGVGLPLPPPTQQQQQHHTPLSPLSSQHREDILEGRIVALTKENEKLRADLAAVNGGLPPRPAHSRTSSLNVSNPNLSKSPVHNNALHNNFDHSTHSPYAPFPSKRSEEDMMSLSGSGVNLAYFEATSSSDPRYHQLLQEFRRLLTSTFRHGTAEQWQHPPLHHPQSPSYNASNSSQAILTTPTTKETPSFNASSSSPGASAKAAPAEPPSPKIPPASPTLKLPPKLAAPPLTMPGKKLSKKQQEAQSEAMSKEAYVTHLERLIALRDEQLSKYEGRGPEMLDSACQATVKVSVARTQTDEGEDVGSGDSDEVSGRCEGNVVLLEAQSLMTQCGLTTLRPLSLQLYHEASQCGSSPQNSSASPQPKWSHRPYIGTTGKRTSSLRLSESGVAEQLEIMPPLPSSTRWADEPCEMDSRHEKEFGASTSSATIITPTLGFSRGDNSNRAPSTSSSVPNSQQQQQVWRGGSRASARQSSAQTL